MDLSIIVLESEVMTPTPLVVFMKPSHSSTKTKHNHPNIIILKQQTSPMPMKSNSPKFLDMFKEENLLTGHTEQKPHLDHNSDFINELYSEAPKGEKDIHTPKDQNIIVHL